VISMAVGEPDFPAPKLVQSAAVEKIRSGDVRYTPAAGTPSLRKAVAEHLSATRGTPYASEEITICHSAKHALSGAISALVDEGDEVLVPLPAWASYFDLVRMCGGTPVLVPPERRDGVRPDLSALSRALSPRTKALMINSPNNPSGYVFTREDLEAWRGSRSRRTCGSSATRSTARWCTRAATRSRPPRSRKTSRRAQRSSTAPRRPSP